MIKIKKSINNEGLAKGNARRMIVIHHTGGGYRDYDEDGKVGREDLKKYNEANRKYLNRSDYISAHYFVGTDGTVWQLVEDDRVAYHCGVSGYKNYETKNNSLNWCSLGVEVNSDGVNFTQEQREATRELILKLMEKYDIPPGGVVRHKDIAPHRKWDVGDNFWKEEYGSWEEYQAGLEREMVEVQMEEVADWARGAVRKCAEKGVAKKWLTPEEIVAGPTAELMLCRSGILERYTGRGISKQRLAVILERLNLI